MERSFGHLPPVQQVLKGNRGTMVFRDPDSGQERSAAFLPLSTGWGLVLIQPSASTMLVPPVVSQRTTLLIMAFGLLLGVLATAFLSRRLALPIERFSEQLHLLTREEVRPDRAETTLTPGSGVLEHERMLASVKTLYEALAQTIFRLEAKTNELILSNQELAVTVENLKHLDKLRADFLNMISHDLRIPLTSVMGYAELLQEAATLGTAEQAYVTQILEACQRIQAMLEELLDYARMEVGRLQLDIQPIDLGAAVTESVAFFKPLAEQMDLSLSATLPIEPPMVLADPDRLRQILVNLISNAVKYTPPGGAIAVQACTNGGATIEVRDTGIGLTEEDKRHLFEKFFRSARPEVRQEKGSGLGLSLVKGVVEAQGGRIGVESQVGRGSTFYVTLPTPES